MQPDSIAPYLDGSLSYSPQLAKVTGGVTAAILLAYVLAKQSQTVPSSGWIEVTTEVLESATGLTREEQEFARQKLGNRGFLREQLRDGTWEFCLNWDVLQKQLAAFSRLIFQSDLAPESQPQNQETFPRQDRSTNPSRSPKTDPFFQRDRAYPTAPVSPQYQFAGPWQSTEQFEQFQKALLAYATQQGWQYSAAWTFKIIDSITKGIISPFWEEFIAGKPLGSSQKIQQEWEVEAGVPYPAFEEERIQYYRHKGEPIEAAVARARADLRNPVLGKDLWAGFLRKCDRLADEAMRAKKLGVKTPYLPSSFTEKPQANKEQVMQKLTKVASQPALKSSCENEASIPTLEILQNLYNSSLGRVIAQQQIAQHPEWGYEIVEGKIVQGLR